MDETVVRAWAKEHGFRLVPERPIANWHPVLRALFSQDRIIYAVKLWAEITRAPNVPLDLAAANGFITRVRNHSEPFPSGREHPDIPAERVRYYANQPWCIGRQ